MVFLTTNEVNTSINRDFPYYSYGQFDFDASFRQFDFLLDVIVAECVAEFLFEKRHILLLEKVLQIPSPMKCFHWNGSTLCVPEK